MDGAGKSTTKEMPNVEVHSGKMSKEPTKVPIRESVLGQYNEDFVFPH